MVSIIIPVFNGGENFRRTLSSIKKHIDSTLELIVVVDGGTDTSQQDARQFGAKVLELPDRGGPARARNRGAAIAQGDILFFVDADVTLHADTLSQIQNIFGQQPDLAALIGSYDDAPGATNFLSQYKNLFHHYTHQTAKVEASTFWGACGAIRREVFEAIGGFDEAYRFPSIEDIELGYRLRRAGYRIQLCKSVQVKHLKRWEIGSLLRAEFFYRALPWTELLWRDRQLINDLNLTTSNRLSVVFAFTGLFAGAIALWSPLFLGITLICVLFLLLMNQAVYLFFVRKRNLWFALQVIPWHWLYFLYSGLAFACGTVSYKLRQQKSG
ncbi:MAG: glycosyltransferase [Oculatellaceae cyanobacterium Prado106]|jgi:GT2 family glycosyltransferase|nr:glycosyltransferase [Oculatellaceae cyanobacterium Prado106]